jgi:hypothetical protein
MKHKHEATTQVFMLHFGAASSPYFRLLPCQVIHLHMEMTRQKLASTNEQAHTPRERLFLVPNIHCKGNTFIKPSTIHHGSHGTQHQHKPTMVTLC